MSADLKAVKGYLDRFNACDTSQEFIDAFDDFKREFGLSDEQVKTFGHTLLMAMGNEPFDKVTMDEFLSVFKFIGDYEGQKHGDITAKDFENVKAFVESLGGNIMECAVEDIPYIASAMKEAGIYDEEILGDQPDRVVYEGMDTRNGVDQIVDRIKQHHSDHVLPKSPMQDILDRIKEHHGDEDKPRKEVSPVQDILNKMADANNDQSPEPVNAPKLPTPTLS